MTSLLRLHSPEVMGEIRNKIMQKNLENYIILSYYLHQIEKYNCLSETELTSREGLNSCEIILKAASLADHECVECTINVWIIDHNYFHKLARAF